MSATICVFRPDTWVIGQIIDGSETSLYPDAIELDVVLSALAALSHRTRLEAFRCLLRAEPNGLSTGQLVDASGLTQSTFSTHLAVLVAANLVIGEKQGRQIIQRANVGTLRDMMVFLAKECCAGNADFCEPLIAELSCL